VDTRGATPLAGGGLPGAWDNPRVARRRSHTALGALAAAGAGALGLWHQLFRRPLPKTRGSLRVRGLEADVEIARDRLGVPRITARSVADLCFAQGFAVCQERGWQLDLYRRVASGYLSELAGEATLLADKMTRTFGLRRVAEQELGGLPARAREMLEAYAEGVNAAYDAAPAPAIEHQLLRIEPGRWSAVDSLALGKVLALGFSTNMETELFRAELVSLVGPEKAARLEPQYPGGSPIVTAPGTAWSGDAAVVAEQIAEVRGAMGFSPLGPPAGSNNWVVSGERSATGMPLMAGDPHISTSIPNVWYSVELSAPGVELRGGAMPGFPGVVIGQGRDVAWSFTNVMADVQDLFVEQVRTNHDGMGLAYLFEDDWRPLTIHLEEIHVRGRAVPERVEVWETHHGPIVNGPLGAGGGEPLALSWTALREPFFTSIGLDVGGIASGTELVERFEDFHVPCMNMVWGDSGGHIGYKLVGKLPRRPGGCPDLPKPGWTGEYEWDGYVPYDELPRLDDPEDGVIVTANNRIAPDDYPHHITSEYLDGYRAARIEQLLLERERHSLDSFERIQADVYSIPGAETARRLARLRPPGQREIRAIERLKSWDHRLDADTVAGTIYAAFTVHFARAVSEAAIGDVAEAARWRSKSLLGFTPMTSSPWRFHARLLELWEEADTELVGGRSWEELALEALGSALAELEERFGSDPAGWRWGRVHGVRFGHPLGEGKSPLQPLLERLFSRSLPAGGGQETPNAIGYVPHDGDYEGTWAPSYRLLADLGDPGRSRWQHMTGQSGHPGSPHYDDLLEDWLACRSNPFGQPPVVRLELLPA
jgi:penicillin G amidase